MPPALSLNLYEVLGIERESTAEYAEVSLSEIKQGYHSSLLIHHPDKQQQKKDSISTDESIGRLGVTIPAIKTAYQILINPERRKEYDSKLKLGIDPASIGVKAPKAANDQIDLDDMNVFTETAPDGVTETYTWTRSCRCGEKEGYILNEQDLEDNGPESTSITVQCIGCSLWIEVLYAIEG